MMMSSNKLYLKNTSWLDYPKLYLKWPLNQCALFLMLLVGFRFNFGSLEDIIKVCDYSYLKDVVKFFCKTLVFEFDPYCLTLKERWGMLILSLVGILGNVVPYYFTGNVAKRHTSQSKANMVLLAHIISGIATILFSAVIGLIGGYPGSMSFYCHAVIDTAHSLTTFPLLRNHDGIYPLRAGNMHIALVKIRALLNFNGRNGLLTADVIFMASFGFMGTRIATAAPQVILHLTGNKRVMKFGHWYSLGLGFAQSFITYQIPGSEEMWLACIILTSVWFYHELWNKKYQPAFFVFNCAYAVLCLALLKQQRLYFYIAKIAYYAAMIRLRHFKRHPIKMAQMMENNGEAIKHGVATGKSEAMELKEKVMIFDRRDTMFD